MARLRHIAVCVKDLEKAAKFYATVFEMKEVGRETIEIGSAIYMSDGVINMALLNFAGNKGNDLKDPKNAVGANHFGFQVDDIAETQKKIEAAGGKFSSTSATSGRETSSASSRTPMASCSISPSTAGWAPTATSASTIPLASNRRAGNSLPSRRRGTPARQPDVSVIARVAATIKLAAGR